MWKYPDSFPGSSLNPLLLGFLSRPHYIGVIDEIIGCWWLIQPPASLPSPEIRLGTESSNVLFLVGSLVPNLPHLWSQSCLVNIVKSTLMALIISGNQRFSGSLGFLVAQIVKNPPAVQETQVRFLGWENPLEKGMATHSSNLAWRIPWTEEPGRLQSMRSQRVRHKWATIRHQTYNQ